MGDRLQFYFDNLFRNATITASSGATTAYNTLDMNIRKMWASVSSNDTVTETLEYVLASAVPITTIFLCGCNVKAGNIQYSTGGAYTDFSTPIAWTSAKENQRFTFNSVSPTKIKITMTTTTPANSEKRIGILVATTMGFELAINPAGITPTRSYPIQTLTNSRGMITKCVNGDSVFGATLDFSNLGSSGSVNDYTYLEELAETGEAFIINFCGDTELTRFPYNWGSIKRCTIVNDEISNPFTAGVASAGDDFSIQIKECF